MSAFAGDELLISPELLYRQGLLSRTDIASPPQFSEEKVQYRKVIAYKDRLFNKAYKAFRSAPRDIGYDRFCKKHRLWLDDYAMFVVLRDHFDNWFWADWPVGLRLRKDKAMASFAAEFADRIEKQKFLQYQFFIQYEALKQYCVSRGVSIIGDMPIYVTYDSSDVWANPDIFKLTAGKKPTALSGVPPDDFCKTGQLWGNPVYDWDALKKKHYSWWFARVAHNMRLSDVIRIDHFRAFVSYWQVPARYRTAEKGKWVDAPGRDFFNKLFKRFADCRLIVEDLGHITDDVVDLVERFDLPGMNILQYAFDGDAKYGEHRVYNHKKNSVVYTGTHDNNTIRGWFFKDITHGHRRKVFEYFGRRIPASSLHWEMIRLAYDSPANLAVIPMQDVLGLDSAGRMNRPGTIKGNWQWRLKSRQTPGLLADKLARLTQTHGRA
jgi:4-alpha-glucanotransferase